MIYSSLLKFSFIWNFHNKGSLEFDLTSFETLKYVCVIKMIEILSFLPLINNSVTIGFSFLCYLNIDILLHMDLLHIDISYQYLAVLLLNEVMHLFFLI